MQTKGVSAYISTPLELFSDDKADNRNKPLTITGKGFKNGVTVIVYLDKNKNDMRDAGDVDLDSEVVGSNDAFESTFNVTVPPFEAGMKATAFTPPTVRTRPMRPALTTGWSSRSRAW